MKGFKSVLFIILMLLLGCVVLATAFSPIIISAITGNWLFMFLYAVIWSAVWLEVILFIALLAIIGELWGL